MRINMTIEAKRVRGDLHMPELFQRDRCVIGKHVRNIFKEGELEKKAVWATGILKEYMKKGYGKNMTKREKQLKIREQKHKWAQIGMFGEKRSCPYCEGINIIQIYKHDAWACIDCNEWLEEPCNDFNCPYCGGRPETPYEVYWNTDFNAGSSHTRKMWRRENYQHKMKGEFRKNDI